MRKHLLNFILLTLLHILFMPSGSIAQTLEWRLTNPTFAANDPDGSGPATGVATFTLQIHTVSGTVNNVNSISVGWSYQSAKAMIPTTPGCNIVSNPANIVLSPEFTSAGFAYTTVNQCGVATQTIGGQTFDRRTVGTLDGTSINITTTWINVFTVTMWGFGDVNTGAGLAVINSSSGGSPAPLSTYAVSDNLANEYIVNSQTYTTALLLPVQLSKLEATCTANGAVVKWQTVSENNTDRFEVEKSADGVIWNIAGSISAAGSSAALKQYEFSDAQYHGTAFYRLRQVDKDGKIVYSPAVKTNCDSKTPGLLIYPVPVKNTLNVAFTLAKNSKITIDVLDIAGRIYQSIQKDLLKGRNQIALDVSRVSAGQYIVRIAHDGQIQNRKIVIE